MIRLLVLDVDGCLTDGRIVYTDSGDQLKAFNVKDGLGIRTWIDMGRQVAIITGKESDIVRRRAAEFGVKHLYQGIKDKGMVLRKILDEENIAPEACAVIGDDLNDLKMIALCGRSFAPSDASSTIKARVDVQLMTRGGEGAVREMIEMLIDEEGKMEEFVALWA